MWCVCCSLMFHLKCVTSTSSVIVYGVQRNGVKPMYLTVWLASAWPKCSKINIIYLTTNTSESCFIEHKGIRIFFSWHIQKYKHHCCHPTSCSSGVGCIFRAITGKFRGNCLSLKVHSPGRLAQKSGNKYTIQILHAQTLMSMRCCRSCKAMRNQAMHINKWLPCLLCLTGASIYCKWAHVDTSESKPYQHSSGAWHIVWTSSGKLGRFILVIIVCHQNRIRLHLIQVESSEVEGAIYSRALGVPAYAAVFLTLNGRQSCGQWALC